MRLLPDTHAFLWWLAKDHRLSASALFALTNPVNELYLSSISGFEIATKVAIGKLKLPCSIGQFIAAGIVQGRVQECSLTMKHAYHVASLPLIHRDPFDRLLIATALDESFAIITDDREIRKYDVEIVW